MNDKLLAIFSLLVFLFECSFQLNANITTINQENSNLFQIQTTKITKLQASNSNFPLKYKSKSTNCSNSKEIQCNGIAKCIGVNQVCDGYFDCPDKSDEKNCHWCNRTFNNDANSRLLIQSPLILHANQSNYHCYYKIINTRPNVITGIRLRKFSVGHFNAKRKTCEQSWIEIGESNSLLTNDKKLVKKRSNNLDKVLIYEKNLTTSSKNEPNETGKFCGLLRNFWSNLYSTKKYITINFYKFNLTSNDTFEFEISFYERESLNPILHSKSTKYMGSSSASSNNKLDYGDELENSQCSFFFKNCTNANYDGCVLASRGFPGIYLRNLKCQYLIKNQLSAKSLINQKLILINDNMQLDGQLCQYQPTGKFAKQSMPNTYFCDRGLRQSPHECNDYLNIYEGINTYNSKIANSNVLVRNMCGMGRLAKIVSKKNGLLIEMESGRNGPFANSGFLFYAMNQKQYFDNYDYFNKLNGQNLNSNELNSLKQIEKLQIEYCNSNMKQCSISINDDVINQIYENSNSSSQFRIGYLYNLNQYHPENFTLKYLLRTKNFNSIAIYLDKYNPNGGQSNSKGCDSNYLTIETTNQLLTANRDEEEEDYDEYSYLKSNDYSINQNHSTGFSIYEENNHNNNNNNNNNRNVLLKLCEPILEKDSKISILHQLTKKSNDYQHRSARFYLIRSSELQSSFNSNELDYNDEFAKSTTTSKSSIQSTTNVLISYFNSNQTIQNGATQFDFKITFEFFNFDWQTYKSQSVCDFNFNLNEDSNLPMAGYIQNPQASIFYKTTDQLLKCKYKFIGRTNYYIKLTFESVEFGQDADKNNANIFYTDANQFKTNNEKCSSLGKKLLVKEILDHAKDEEEFENEEEYAETRLCLSGLKKNLHYVYISRNDAVQVDYEVKLPDKANSLNDNQFLIKYEFINRNCNKFHYKMKKTNSKGNLVHVDSNHYGVQSELIDMKDLFKSRANSDFQHQQINNLNRRINQYFQIDEETQRENDMLKQILLSNLNFHCKFNLRAPANSFIHMEIDELRLNNHNENNKCDQNHMKLYSNLTSPFEPSAKIKNDRPVLRFCDSNDQNSENKIRTIKNTEESNYVLLAEFFENNDQSSQMPTHSLFNKTNLSCPSSNKICLNTNELFSEHELASRAFHSNLLIEIYSLDVKKLLFDIKYHFFQVKYLNSISTNSFNNKEKINWINSWLNKNKNNDLYCQFKCSNLNDFLEANQTSFYCLDQSLVCDGKADCIVNSRDELNCPTQMHAKFILTALLSLFAFTCLILVIFCLFNKISSMISNNNNNKTSKTNKNISYKRAASNQPELDF